MCQQGFVLWFTGLSGAGKSTLASSIGPRLRGSGHKVEVLDGDELRESLSKGLGFSKQDRDAHIRRVGFIANLLSRNGVVAIAAAISPYRQIRDEVLSRTEAPFLEIFVDAPLQVLESRDVKGLYKKARAGEIKQFTGISDPYEAPLRPEIHLDTGRETVEQSSQAILDYLEKRGLSKG